MNLCMVGYGGIAEEHFQAFKKIGGVNPYCVVGRIPEKSDAFARAWGCRYGTTDLVLALEDEQVDAVVIASPSDVHAEQTVLALDAGKHVLTEIPMGTNWADCLRVEEAAQRAAGKAMVAQTNRYYPALRELKARTERGEIRIQHIMAQYATDKRKNQNWKGAARSWVDNLLWHHSCHVVDATLWVAGRRADDVHCSFGNVHPEWGNPLDLSISLRLEDGALISIAASYRVAPSRYKMLFVADEGTFEFDDGVLTDGAGRQLAGPIGLAELVYHQDVEFVAAVREGREPEITPADVIGAMQVLHRADGSGR